jgi:hypothetical protein
MIEFDEPLSVEGRQRRDQILDVAKRAARTHRRQRLAARSIAGSAAILGMIALVVHTANQFQFRSPHPATPVVALVHPTSPPQQTLLVEQIQTDPTITQRLSVLPSPRWQEINDDELIQSLANAGQPAGLVKMADQTILVTSEQDQ